jgi:hypothetical protein
MQVREERTCADELESLAVEKGTKMLYFHKPHRMGRELLQRDPRHHLAAKISRHAAAAAASTAAAAVGLAPTEERGAAVLVADVDPRDLDLFSKRQGGLVSRGAAHYAIGIRAGPI